MPDAIVTLARKFLHSPVTVHAGHAEELGVSPQTKQYVYRTHSLNKLEMLARILQAKDRGLTMIFSRTKRNCDRVTEDLDFRGFAAAAVHGDLNQGARERALRAFRAGKIDVLVATDVAARGIDITAVTHVINFDCPEDPETYVHRIGRTGRAGATGIAVTFVDWEDMPRWRIIDKTLEIGEPEPRETYHTSEWLYSELDIPTDTAATLPTAQRSRAGLSAEKEEDLGGGRRRTTRGTPRQSDSQEKDSKPRSRRRRRNGEVVAEGAEAPSEGAVAAEPVREPAASEKIASTMFSDASGAEAPAEWTPPKATRRRRRGPRKPAAAE
jgi:superfamily II DNA/RNA helicase